MANEIKGRDMSAPVQYIAIDGVRYPMVYSNKAARIVEDVYETEYGKNIGYYDIIREMALYKHRAIMAMTYAAIRAGGADMPWDEFDDKFRVSDIEAVAAQLRRGVLDSLPDEDGDAEKKQTAAPTM